MVRTKNVAVLVGSLRKGSYNRLMAKALVALDTPELDLKIAEIADLPLYNEDLENEGPPAQWDSFRETIRPADAILFVTPEYNRSMPGGLKNAIDVGSRPYHKNAWAGKPGAVISVSRGAMGAFGSNHHLRQSLVAVDISAMPQPEAYIGNAPTLFDDHGHFLNEATRGFVQGFMEAFATWIHRFGA